MASQATPQSQQSMTGGTSGAPLGETHLLSEARGRAATRLVEAARSLMWESGGPTFTVTQVVSRAGTSLKSFYSCFSSKDELLMALFEDDARIGAGALATMVEAERDPLERLRTAIVGLFRFITLDGQMPYAAVLVREHLRLAESRPEELRQVLAPFVALFENGLREAKEGGLVSCDDPARTARTLLHVVVSHLHALICHQIDDAPQDVGDQLWAFCKAALRP